MNQNIIISIVVFALLVLGGAWLHHDGFIQGKAEVIEQDRKEIDAARAKNTKLINDLEDTKNAAQKRIDDYAATHPAQRVYLPSVACKANAAGGISPAVTGGEPLPTQPSHAQESLDRFMGGVEALMHEADTTVNTCRVVMDWARVQALP